MPLLTNKEGQIRTAERNNYDGKKTNAPCKLRQKVLLPWQKFGSHVDGQALDGPVADHGYAGHPWSVDGGHDGDGHAVEVSADLEPDVGQLDDAVHGEDGEEETEVFVLSEKMEISLMTSSCYPRFLPGSSG